MYVDNEGIHHIQPKQFTWSDAAREAAAQARGGGTRGAPTPGGVEGTVGHPWSDATIQKMHPDVRSILFYNHMSQLLGANANKDKATADFHLDQMSRLHKAGVGDGRIGAEILNKVGS